MDVSLLGADYPARTVAYTGTAGVTGTWPAGPGGVLVWCSSAAYVAVGAGVTATAADLPLPANTPITIVVPQTNGAVWRVSALQIAAGGDVYAKPVGGV